MWKLNRVRSKRFSLHGPRSSVRVATGSGHLTYSANFTSRIPDIVLKGVESDDRRGLDRATLDRLLLAKGHFYACQGPLK